jgi:hypothetical protein
MRKLLAGLFALRFLKRGRGKSHGRGHRHH